jgi:replicative DNA helicase
MNPLSSHIDEKCFIGCVVESHGAVLDAFPIEVEAFQEPAFRAIMAAVIDMRKKGEKVCADSVLSRFGGQAMLGHENILDTCFYPSKSMAGQFHATLCNFLALRRARAMGERIVQELEKTTDAQEFCQQLAIEAASLLPATTCDNELEGACDRLTKRLEAMERGEKVQGFPCPLIVWNKAFGGICDGHLYALAARPGLGKTALMEQMVSDYISSNIPVAVFEKDMSPHMLIERMACRASKVSHWNLCNGFVSPKEVALVKTMVGALRETPLCLYNPTNLTPERMSAIVRRDYRVKGIKAVFLDHIQVLDVGRDKREGLTHASITIRQTTTETGIPHIILAHINRNGAKGRPTPEDIKEFDQLYGDCDGMAILWTDADKTKLEPGQPLPMKSYFAKNRNGPTGEEDILFDGRMMTFRNKSDEQETTHANHKRSWQPD